MTVDDREDRASEFMHTLAASEADVANISAEMTQNKIRVSFDHHTPEDVEIVNDVAQEHPFEKIEDGFDEYQPGSALKS